MGKHRMSRHGLRGAVAVVIVGGLAAACSGSPNEPAPVFMKGGGLGIIAGPEVGLPDRPVVGPAEARTITIERGQSLRFARRVQ